METRSPRTSYENQSADSSVRFWPAGKAETVLHKNGSKEIAEDKFLSLQGKNEAKNVKTKKAKKT